MTEDETPSVGDLMRDTVEAINRAGRRMPWDPDRRHIEREPLQPGLRDVILARDGYRCQWCGKDRSSWGYVV